MLTTGGLKPHPPTTKLWHKERDLELVLLSNGKGAHDFEGALAIIAKQGAKVLNSSPFSVII